MVHDVEGFNRRLPEDSLELADRRRYRLGVPRPGLFEDDRSALQPLPAAPFSCIRWRRGTRRASKQGK